jgi:hypothetical protein
MTREKLLINAPSNVCAAAAAARVNAPGQKTKSLNNPRVS